MRLLNRSKHDSPTLSGPWGRESPPYAILSHTWSKDVDEVSFADVQDLAGASKAGYEKIRFCNEQTKKDNLDYFWVDTCCIDKSNHAELSEAINSMFKWYQNAAKCYVYLLDVHFDGSDADADRSTWITAFRESRWFTRGWTLQELLAPQCVNFYSKEHVFLGDKNTLERDIHGITGIPVDALRGTSLTQFGIEERLAWTAQRETTKDEDKAYCLFGIFNVFLPLIYGEGAHAFTRLKEEIERTSARGRAVQFPCNISTQEPQRGSVDRADIVARAEQFLTASAVAPETKCLLLHGLPGSGKTHLADQIARHWVLEGKPAYWFDASSPEVLHQSYLDFAVSAGLCTLQEASNTDARNTRLKLYAHLERNKQPWLLIFDNYDVYQSSKQFTLRGAFPERSMGSVIITSRNAGLRTIFDGIDQAISVQSMSSTEACELFCMSCSVSDELLNEQSRNTITHITSELLGNLPLAVAQAGAFVGHMIEDSISLNDTLRQYVSDFLSNRDTVLEEVDDKFVEVYGQSIITLFNMAFSVIEKKNETASKLLFLFSFYHHHGISSHWFKRVSENCVKFHQTGVDLESSHFLWFRRLVKPQTPGRWSSNALMKAINLLSDYGLLEMTPDAHMLNIHPLIQSWTTIFMQHRNDQSVEHSALLAAAVLCEVFDPQTDEDLQQSQRSRIELWPHAEAWFNTTGQRSTLLTSAAGSSIPGYVYNRLADYLDSYHLPPHHEVRGTVPELRLLAIRSELSRGIVSSRQILYALRQLALWLADHGELADKVVRQQVFYLINALIGRVVSSESGDFFDEITARAEVFHAEMVVAKEDHQESVAIAKLGERYIDSHQERMTEADQIRLLGAFWTMIACFDEESGSRRSSFHKLL